VAPPMALDKLDQRGRPHPGIPAPFRARASSTFSLERVYDSSPTHVFRALSVRRPRPYGSMAERGWVVLHTAIWMSASGGRERLRDVGRAAWYDVRRVIDVCADQRPRLRLRDAASRSENLRIPLHYRARARARGHPLKVTGAGCLPRRLCRMPDRVSTAPSFLFDRWGASLLG